MKPKLICPVCGKEATVWSNEIREWAIGCYYPMPTYPHPWHQVIMGRFKIKASAIRAWQKAFGKKEKS